MTRDDLRTFLANSNVAAFNHVIGAGETNAQLDDSAFTTINGGRHFTDMSRHPYEGQSAPPGLAAGFAQFIPHTWQGLAKEYGFTGFTKQEQLEGAVALLVRRGAISDVVAGRLGDALHKLLEEWTSFQTMSVAHATQVFQQYGGTLANGAPSVVEPTVPAATPTTGRSMGALELLQVFGPILATLIPQIKPILDPNSKSQQKTATVAEAVVNAITTATNQPNLQSAVEAMKADPDVAKAAQTAVVNDPVVMNILEIGAGGIASARAANLAIQTQTDGRWWVAFCQPVFVVSILFSTVIIMIVGNMLGMPWGGSFSDWDANTRSNVIFAVIAGTLGTLSGYWFGTTVQSAKKDAVIAAQAGQSS